MISLWTSPLFVPSKFDNTLKWILPETAFQVLNSRSVSVYCEGARNWPLGVLTWRLQTPETGWVKWFRFWVTAWGWGGMRNVFVYCVIIRPSFRVPLPYFTPCFNPLCLGVFAGIFYWTIRTQLGVSVINRRTMNNWLALISALNCILIVLLTSVGVSFLFPTHIISTH